MSTPVNGTNAKLWIDGEQEIDLVAIQTKTEFKKESYTVCGKMGTYYRIVGYEGKGSIKINKTKNNIKVTKRILSDVKAGKTPSFTIIGAVDDVGADFYERYCFTDVIFDDLTIFDLESQVNATVEMPFTYLECYQL